MKVRNISGEDRFIPDANCVVEADSVVDLPDAIARGLEAQTGLWAIESAPIKKEK